MKHIIFIDVDGTLTGQDGLVPESAKEAIRKTKAKGNEVILATGRSLAELTEDILEIGFDGIIGAGGAYVEYKGHELLHMKFNEEDVIELTDYLNDHEIGYYLESNIGLFANDICTLRIKQASEALFEKHPELFLDKTDPIPNWFLEILEKTSHIEVPYDNINKVSFISKDFPMKNIKSKFGEKYEIYETTVFEFGPHSGEIGLKNIDKRNAIELLLGEVSCNPKTFAFGDGLNDLTMFEYVDHAVAMENAKDALKAVSQEITAIAEEAGIYKSMERNGLL